MNAIFAFKRLSKTVLLTVNSGGVQGGDATNLPCGRCKRLLVLMNAFLTSKRRVGRIVFISSACLAASGSLVAAKALDEVAESDAIVSEKDSVELVADSTVSEAISRRPDLSFRNVTVDGEATQVSLDSISADAVTSVEVMKAVTPDQDADSRGGSISLKTRPAYQQNSVSTKVSLESTYESITGQPGYEIQLNIGGPLNEKRTWGGRLGVGYEDEREGILWSSKDWYRKTVDGQSGYALKELKVFDTREWNRSQEINGGLDFKASDDLRFFWKGSYQLFNNAESMPHVEYRLKDGDYVALDDNGGHVVGATIEQGLYQFESEYEEWEGSFGGEWDKGDLQADFRVQYMKESFTPVSYLNTDFVMSDVDVRYDLEDPRFPTLSITNDADYSDASAYVFEDATFRERVNDESETLFSSNVRWRNAFGNERMTLRMGLKSVTQDDLSGGESSYYDGYLGEGTFSLGDVVSSGRSSNPFGRYRIEQKIDNDAMREFMLPNLDAFDYNERRSRERSDSGAYYAEEQIDALYGMMDYRHGKWRSIVGIRQENTSVNFTANEVLLGKDEADKDGDGNFDEIVYLSTTPAYGSTDYSNFFSNAHVRYRWNDRTTFIASYTNTIKRPFYSQIVPYRRVDLEDREIDEGNPDLDPTLYANIDMSVDLRVGEDGLMSFELFDRQIDDFIFQSESVVQGGLYDGYDLERLENSASAQKRGMSFTWNQPFKLPLIDEGFSFNANYVKQETELEYPSRPGEILPLARAPEDEFKIALNYENDRVFAQLKIDQEDETIYQVGRNPNEDIYVAPGSYMELSVSYQLQNKTRVYFEWANITNEPYFESYEGIPERSASYRYRPWSFETGMKFEL